MLGRMHLKVAGGLWDGGLRSLCSGQQTLMLTIKLGFAMRTRFGQGCGQLAWLYWDSGEAFKMGTGLGKAGAAEGCPAET